MGYFLRRSGWTLTIGAVVAFVIALTHPTGGVQIGQAPSPVVFRSWFVLVTAPVVGFVGLQIAAWGRAHEIRHARRRYRPNSELPRD